MSGTQFKWIADGIAALPADWRERFEERAAIREYEAGFARDVAERLALRETEAEMRAADRAARRAAGR